MAVEVHEISDMGDVVRRNGAEEMAFVVIFIVSICCFPVEPGVIVDEFDYKFIAFIDLME